MVIYFPVSALMTLFAHILQSPQDTRARSDIRLMHQVVSFLHVIAVDEETGGVKRMLDVCSEFERIAKIVVDKADKESHSRRKRKSPKDDEPDAPKQGPEKRPTPAPPVQQQMTPQPPRQATPQPPAAPTPAPSTGLTPGFSGDSSLGPQSTSFSPSLQDYSSPGSSNGASGQMIATIPDFAPRPGDFPNMLTDFSDMAQFGAGGVGSPNMGSFQVPSDLWQMPMGLEWDWSAALQDGQFTNGNGEMYSGQKDVNGVNGL